MPQGPKKKTTPNEGYSNQPSSASTPRDLHYDATCAIHHRTSTSLEARLENPSPTCFYLKQATRSRRASHAIFILPSVLWHNRQTVARLVLRPKPRNHHSDIEAQTGKPMSPVLMPNREKLSPPVLRSNREKPSQWF
jgi:hypothetical protein